MECIGQWKKGNLDMLDERINLEGNFLTKV